MAEADQDSLPEDGGNETESTDEVAGRSSLDLQNEEEWREALAQRNSELRMWKEKCECEERQGSALREHHQRQMEKLLREVRRMRPAPLNPVESSKAEKIAPAESVKVENAFKSVAQQTDTWFDAQFETHQKTHQDGMATLMELVQRQLSRRANESQHVRDDDVISTAGREPERSVDSDRTPEHEEEATESSSTSSSDTDQLRGSAEDDVIANTTELGWIAYGKTAPSLGISSVDDDVQHATCSLRHATC